MQVYVPGPVSVWVDTPGQSGFPTLLGYGENGVNIVVRAMYDAVMNDLGGTQIPFDRLFMGEEGQVSTVLTVFNWGVYESVCMARPDFASTPGTSRFGDLGTEVWGEAAGYNLWLRFPYQTAFTASNPGMVAGYHFFRSFMPENQPLFNTSAVKIPVNFQCIRSYNYSTGSWALYDHNMTGTTVIPPS